MDSEGKSDDVYNYPHKYNPDNSADYNSIEDLIIYSESGNELDL